LRVGALCAPDDPYCWSTSPDGACTGGYCSSAPVDEPEPPTQVGRGGRLRLTGEGGVDLEGAYRETFGLELQAAGSLGLETRWSLWNEPQAGAVDRLLFGEGNLLLELPASPALQVYLGVGGRVLIDPTGQSEPQAGGQGLLRFDVYPARPWVLHARASVGGLGEALTLEAQGTVGVQLHRWELFAGYSLFTLAHEDPVTLSGPLAGVTLTL